MKRFDLNKLVRKAVRDMQAYSSARDEYTSSKGIFMDANENPYGGHFSRYPDPLQVQLRKAFAKEKECSVSQVLFGNGSDEWIDLLIRVFCESGKDQIIYCPPTYGMYKVCADFNGVASVAVPQSIAFGIDSKAVLEKASPSTKLLFLCSPNNPTGKCIPRDQLEYIIARFPGIVVLDEAYIDFVAGKSLLNALDKYPNLVILQTFSKARGLAGLRLGVVFASDKIIEILTKVKLPYNVNQYTQEKALETLQTPSDFRRTTEKLIREKLKLKKALQQFDCIEKVFPSDANFLLLRCTDANALYQFLLKKNIVVRSRTTALHCEECLRISIGSEEQNASLIAAIESYVKTVLPLAEIKK